jgi:hypothetical protein
MTFDIEPMDAISYFLLTLILYFLSALSKRLGDVLGMKKYYYIYYAGMVFTLLGCIMSLLSGGNIIFLKYVFLAIGVTLGLVASIKYWGWLIKELIKE